MERSEEILALLSNVIETAQSLDRAGDPPNSLQALEAKVQLHSDIQRLVGEPPTPIRLR